MTLYRNSNIVKRRYPFGVAVLAILLSCFTLNGFTSKTGTHPSIAFVGKNAGHSQHNEPGYYTNIDRASEHFFKLLAEDIESNDEEITPFAFDEPSRPWHLDARYFAHTTFHNRSHDDRKPIPLYTLHHSWKSFLS